jgi:hypothetical protein
MQRIAFSTTEPVRSAWRVGWICIGTRFCTAAACCWAALRRCCGNDERLGKRGGSKPSPSAFFPRTIATRRIKSRSFHGSMSACSPNGTTAIGSRICRRIAKHTGWDSEVSKRLPAIYTGEALATSVLASRIESWKRSMMRVHKPPTKSGDQCRSIVSGCCWSRTASRSTIRIRELQRTSRTLSDGPGGKRCVGAFRRTDPHV